MNYQIDGGTLPVVIINLDAGEKVVTEGGGMSWMSPNMKMETSGGGLGKMFSRAVSGESVFQNIYTAEGGPGFIACASSFPGSIRAFEIGPGNNMVFQKSAFLASVGNIELSVHFKKKLGAGMFGGEGFIMQKVSGQGVAFAEFDGHVVEYDLQPGQQIVLDTGHLAADLPGFAGFLRRTCCRPRSSGCDWTGYTLACGSDLPVPGAQAPAIRPLPRSSSPGSHPLLL